MITIITGVPGMGKTALVVSMMMEELEKGERPFFVMGIPDLKLDHSPVPPVSEWTEKRPDKDDPEVLLDYYTFPPNSIIVIDEAQRVFRPRASSSKVPPHVAAQETHRHTGVDFWLLTQKPSLLDSNIRELAGRHIHLKNTIMGRKLYEWPEYNDVNSKANLSMAIKRSFSPPKQAFKNYKSAELHTKQIFRFHQIYFVLALALSFLGFFGYKLYTGLYQRVSGNSRPAAADQNKNNDLIPNSSQANKPELTKVNDVQPIVTEPIKHPFYGFDFVIKATITSAKFNRTYYEIRKGSNVVFTDSEKLEKLGYSINQNSDCSAFLFFKGAEIVATCQADGGGDFARQGGGDATVKPILPAPTDAQNYPHTDPA